MARKDVTWVPDPAGQQFEFRSWEGTVGKFMRKKTTEVHIRSKVTAPRRTGALAAGHIKSEGHTNSGELEGQVIAVPEYALYVHEGTKPHVILPRRKKVLRFFSQGIMVFTPDVFHPGNKANKYMLRALQKAIKTFS